MIKIKHFIITILAIGMINSCANNAQERSESESQSTTSTVVESLLLYTTEAIPSDDTLWTIFYQQTGIQVNVKLFDPQALIPTLQSQNEQVDVVIFPEVGLAHEAKQLGLLQFHDIPELGAYYKSMARDESGFWTGLSRKHLSIAYAHERVREPVFNSFMDLTSSRWKNRILLPSIDDPYLVSLISSMLIHNGEATAKRWINGVLANQQLPPVKSAKSRLESIASGEADITIVNAGDLGQLKNPPTYEELLAGEACQIAIPRNGDFHTYVNISCAAVPQNGNIAKAVKLIRFLTSKDVQVRYAGSRHEFPVDVMALPSEFLIEVMGGMREDELELETLAAYRSKAQQFLVSNGWPNNQ
jgi:iron(III) transport system substrate-binding protein